MQTIYRQSVGAFALVELLLVVGLLALMLPAVFVVLAASEESAHAAGIESLSPWVIPRCVELGAASPDGGAWAIAGDGRVVGRLSMEGYDRGLREFEGVPVRYVCGVRRLAETDGGPDPKLNRLVIRFEYPAVEPAVRRRHFDFYASRR